MTGRRRCTINNGSSHQASGSISVNVPWAAEPFRFCPPSSLLDNRRYRSWGRKLAAFSNTRRWTTSMPANRGSTSSRCSSFHRSLLLRQPAPGRNRIQFSTYRRASPPAASRADIPSERARAGEDHDDRDLNCERQVPFRPSAASMFLPWKRTSVSSAKLLDQPEDRNRYRELYASFSETPTADPAADVEL